MHGPIRDGLEDLLASDRGGQVLSGQVLTGHLASCAECASELEAMKEQQVWLATLRAPELEPAAGFYARVIQRIEERGNCSFWSFFVDSAFSRRLAVASLTIVVALGSYLVTQETHERNIHGRPTATSFMAWNSDVHYDVPVMGSRSEQREAVLDNLAIHQGAGIKGQIQ
jgi:hypothetical protein